MHERLNMKVKLGHSFVHIHQEMTAVPVIALSTVAVTAFHPINLVREMDVTGPVSVVCQCGVVFCVDPED